MKIKVHTNSSQEKIEKKKDLLEIWIKNKPIKGKANAYIEKILKRHFKKPLKIISGKTSRYKKIEFI
jgi:uncharacterized protein (TIGR00251 family)